MKIYAGNIIEKTRTRKLIERSIIFTITFIGFLTFIVFDLFFCYVYELDGFQDMQWLAFWTHLSNTGALIWITLALIAVVFNIEGLEKQIQHWNIKNTVFTFIIVTGLVFMFVAYIPVIITYTQEGPINELKELAIQMNNAGFLVGKVSNVDIIANRAMTFTTINGDVITTDPDSVYRTMVIVGTTFKHLIIPAMFIYLAFTELGYYKTRDISDKNRTMIQFIWPALYFAYILTFCAAGVFNPPYPVLDLGFSYLFYANMDTVMSQTILISVYLVIDISMGILFILISMLQNKWNQYYLKKHNKKIEIE